MVLYCLSCGHNCEVFSGRFCIIPCLQVADTKTTTGLFLSMRGVFILTKYWRIWANKINFEAIFVITILRTEVVGREWDILHHCLYLYTWLYHVEGCWLLSRAVFLLRWLLTWAGFFPGQTSSLGWLLIKLAPDLGWLLFYLGWLLSWTDFFSGLASY